MNSAVGIEDLGVCSSIRLKAAVCLIGGVLAMAVMTEAASAQVGGRSQLEARLDSAAAAYVSDSTVAGAAVAVVQGSDTLLQGLRADRPPGISPPSILGGTPSRCGIFFITPPAFRTFLSFPRLQDLRYKDLPRDTALTVMGQKMLCFARGTAMSYSNTGYFLLGLIMIIEETNGEPLKFKVVTTAVSAEPLSDGKPRGPLPPPLRPRRSCRCLAPLRKTNPPRLLQTRFAGR